MHSFAKNVIMGWDGPLKFYTLEVKTYSKGVLLQLMYHIYLNFYKKLYILQSDNELLN